MRCPPSLRGTLSRDTVGRMEIIEVTRLYCPKSGGQPGEDNTTHHLVPRFPRGGKAGEREHVCRDCGKTEAELREEAQA